MRPFIWPFKYGIGSYFPLFPVLISFLVIISYFERRKHRYMYSVLPSLNAIFIQDWFPSAYNKIHSNNSAVLANYIEHSISRSHKKNLLKCTHYLSLKFTFHWFSCSLVEGCSSEFRRLSFPRFLSCYLRSSLIVISDVSD